MQMEGSAEHKVHYCCVAKGGRILHAENGAGADPEIENVAALCVESAPLYHRWYSQTVGKRSFGFLMDDGIVYFAIVDEELGKPGLVGFLEHLRNEFKKVNRRGLKDLNSVCLREQLVSILGRLITSLEHVSQTSNDWAPSPSPSPSPSPGDVLYGELEAAATSTRAPLLGKASKQERRIKDHVIAMKDVELEEHRRSTDRGFRDDADSNSQGSVVPPVPLRKDMGSMRIRSGSQNIRRKWCRLVRIALAIDVVVCVVFLLVWLWFCQGFQCIQ